MGLLHFAAKSRIIELCFVIYAFSIEKMTIKLSWDNEERTALLYQFPEKWTWDDFYVIKKQADVMLDELDHSAALIFDMSLTRSIPTGVLSQSKKLLDNAHPHGTPIILVGTSLIIQAMLNLVGKFNLRATELILAVNTVDQAREIVRKRSQQ